MALKVSPFFNLVGKFQEKIKVASLQVSKEMESDLRDNIIASQDTQSGNIRRAKDESGKGEIVGSTPDEYPNIETGQLLEGIYSMTIHDDLNYNSIARVGVDAYNNGVNYAGVIDDRNKFLEKSYGESRKKIQNIIEKYL